MKAMLLKLEPIIWFLFGQSILLGTMLLTGWCLVVGIAIPMGLVSADALSFGRAHSLASSLIGRLVLALIIILPIWKGAHHLRHVSIDLRGGDRDAAVATALYVLATAGSIGAILAVVRL